MDTNKGILVPINYGGQWIKGSDDCWKYDALFTRYIRVKGSTTFSELIDKICVETGISKADNIIEVKAWISYPMNTVMPPFIMLRNSDISTFIELNDKRDFIVPLCISTMPKTKIVVAPIPQVVVAKIEPVSCNPISKSVNQPERGTFGREENNVVSPSIGLEDIKLTNPLDAFVANNDAHSMYNHKEEVDEEESCNNAEFENDDPFNYVADEDMYERPDPFGCVLSGLLDPYFGAFVKSHLRVNPEKSGHPTENVEENATENVEGNASTGPKKYPNNPVFTGTYTPRTSSFGKNGPSESQSYQQSTNVNVHVLKDFNVGDLVNNKAELLLRLRIISLKANREFCITHSNRHRIIITCVEKSCMWRLRGAMSKKHGAWIIRSYSKVHTCSIDSRFKRNRGCATSEVIAHMVKDDKDSPGDVALMLEKVYGLKISYWKAWRAKEIAMQLIRGNPEESFNGLPSYLWLLKNANPGTYTAYELDVNNCFVQCFVSFGPSIAGFVSSVRPVIAVDACFLKGRYKGKLFIATCMDGNNQIYPLAFGIAATENDASWSWFFQEIRQVIGSREDLVFISDRHPSIEKCCMEQFPDSVYGICMFHLGLNMNARYKVKAKDFLYGVAKSYTEIEFNEKLHHVRSNMRQVYDYLMDADPKKWARCFFPARRYSIMTTNIAESMNARLKEEREFPIIALLETIRTILQGWFHDRLRVANKCTSTLTPYAERKLGKRDDKSRHFVVHPIDEFRFYILDGQRDATVDINMRTCNCNKFQLNQLPCAHAIKACRVRNLSAYTLCSRFYTIESLRLSYALPFNPVPHRSEWYQLVPQSVQDVVVRPPIVQNKKGRRRNKRIPSQGEETIKKRCGRCREPGHNRQTCKGSEYVPSQSQAI